jgi:DnaJ-class molecular chaperone
MSWNEPSYGREAEFDALANDMFLEGDCPACDGTGEIDGDDESKTCPSCGGSGFVDPPEFDEEK